MTMLKSLAVYESIRSRILSGELPQGTRLVHRHLAYEHDTSEIPVREALRMLERDGLVEIVPYQGARVVSLSPQDIEEGYFIRGHLEALATRTAVGNLTEEHFERLERCIQEMGEALDVGDGIAYGELNREFHDTIFEASPYRRLQELIDNLWDGQVAYQRVFNLSDQWLRSSYEEHGQILEALREGNVERAEAAALEHKLEVSRVLIQMLDDETDDEEDPEARSA